MEVAVSASSRSIFTTVELNHGRRVGSMLVKERDLLVRKGEGWIALTRICSGNEK